MLKVGLIVLFLTSCATYHSTDKFADGRSTTVSITEFGRSEAIAEFADTTTKDGRSISVGSAKSDVNVQAIEATTGSIGAIVGEALKVYTGRP